MIPKNLTDRAAMALAEAQVVIYIFFDFPYSLDSCIHIREL